MRMGPPLRFMQPSGPMRADDCVQEALVELARQRQSPEHVLAWLYRVVKVEQMNHEGKTTV
jgi:DNA-directed RNA polymerase specialized sigma24 family protein